jgi:predicted nuclease of predicted toxin-antitoxin system
MRFKTDENLPDEVAEMLRDAGWDALSVVAQGMQGSSDAHLAEVCTHEARTLITLDLGFGNIKAYPPRTHAGIIVLRPARPAKPTVLALVSRVIDALRLRSLDNELWIVDERKLRIRS